MSKKYLQNRVFWILQIIFFIEASMEHPWKLHFSHVIFIDSGPILGLYAKMLLANQIAGFFNYWRYISTEATKVIKVKHGRGYGQECPQCSEIS